MDRPAAPTPYHKASEQEDRTRSVLPGLLSESPLPNAQRALDGPGNALVDEEDCVEGEDEDYGEDGVEDEDYGEDGVEDYGDNQEQQQRGDGFAEADAEVDDDCRFSILAFGRPAAELRGDSMAA
eukprot:7039303-Prymnesium_polylepis.1